MSNMEHPWKNYEEKHLGQPRCDDSHSAAACSLPNWVALYHAVNNMLATIGADGEMNADQQEIVDIFTALEPIDGGQYNHLMKA